MNATPTQIAQRSGGVGGVLALYPDDLREARERLKDEFGEANVCKKTVMAMEVILLAIMSENAAEMEKDL